MTMHPNLLAEGEPAWGGDPGNPRFSGEGRRVPPLDEKRRVGPGISGPTLSGRLVLDRVHKRFGAGEPVLDDVSITCEPGETVAIVGPSGCGKSTLLGVAGGVLAPDAGEVRLDGEEVTGPGPDRAMVFQEHALLPWRTALANVELGLELGGVPRAERRERARAALADVQLAGAAGKLVHELSGGMRQRVAIARALVLAPKVLLMDEPFGALDPRTRAHLHDVLERAVSALGVTTLFVTHSIGEAVRLSDRVVVLAQAPGAIRKEFAVELERPRATYPRDAASHRELARRIRAEIEDEARRRHPDGRGRAEDDDELSVAHVPDRGPRALGAALSLD
jgi:NitT/TauT family transport system ATP-binding protein